MGSAYSCLCMSIKFLKGRTRTVHWICVWAWLDSKIFFLELLFDRESLYAYRSSIDCIHELYIATLHTV